MVPGQYRVYGIARRSNHELKAAQCAEARRPKGQRQFTGVRVSFAPIGSCTNCGRLHSASFVELCGVNVSLLSHCPQVIIVPPPRKGSCDQADGNGPRGQTQESGNNRPTQGGVVALPSFPASSLCTEFGERPGGCWTPHRTSSANSKVRGGEVRPTSCLEFVCALEPRYASQLQMCLLTSGASLRGRVGTDTMFQ